MSGATIEAIERLVDAERPGAEVVSGAWMASLLRGRVLVAKPDRRAYDAAYARAGDVDYHQAPSRTVAWWTIYDFGGGWVGASTTKSLDWHALAWGETGRELLRLSRCAVDDYGRDVATTAEAPR